MAAARREECGYRTEPLLRDPRVALCAILGMLGATRADPTLYALLAGDVADHAVALDYVDEHRLHEVRWPVVDAGWPEATGHEHVWLPVTRGGWSVLDMDGVPRRRCTCGVFEHEEWTHSERNCRDPRCWRARGHRGPHMARTWDAQAGLEIVDEWGDVNPADIADLLDERAAADDAARDAAR